MSVGHCQLPVGPCHGPTHIMRSLPNVKESAIPTENSWTDFEFCVLVQAWVIFTIGPGK